MSAYRAGGQFLWDALSQAIDAAGLSRQELRAAASQAWQNHDRYTDAMAEGYRDVVVEQLIQRDQERAALVSGLIDGRFPAGITAWNAAHQLGLPEIRGLRRGRYRIGSARLPDIAERGEGLA